MRSNKSRDLLEDSDPLATLAKPVGTSPASYWKKPLSMKQTDSGLFDSRGNAIKSSTHQKEVKKNVNEMDGKTKLFMSIFLAISLFLMINAMSPSRKF